jgi:hypothetical protein
MNKKLILIGFLGLMLSLSSPGWTLPTNFTYSGNDYTAKTVGPFSGPEVPGTYNGFNFPNSGDYEFTVVKGSPGGANDTAGLVEAALEAVHGTDFTVVEVPTFCTNCPDGYSGEWATYQPVQLPVPQGAVMIDYYAVKAGPMFALYNENPAAAYGTWNTENVVVGQGETPQISHFSGYSVGGGGKVPEPATMILLGSGLVGLAGYARRRMKK